MAMDVRLRAWIAHILKRRQDVLAVAVRQRAKFEGWLKFELASYAECHGAEDVEVEEGSAEGASRSDLSFSYDGVRYHVELKTVNTNWRMPGVRVSTRPITKNIAGVVRDAKKLSAADGRGIVAFAMFPISHGDRRWVRYLDRIGSELSLDLSEAKHSSRVRIPLNRRREAEIVVVAFRAR